MASNTAATEKRRTRMHKNAGRKRKNRNKPWASMTAEQKADRGRKMLAGRGRKPK